MVIKVSKPEFNLRSKLNEIGGRVSYENMPSGSVITTRVWNLPALAVSTSGSWAYNTVPNSANTYNVDTFTFRKKLSSTIVQGIAVGHVDVNGATGHPTVVSLTNGSTTVFGAAYRHQRVQNQEPDAYTFAFTDDMLNQSDPLNAYYSLRCHSSASNMYFSRMQAGTTQNNPYRVIFQEVIR